MLKKIGGSCFTKWPRASKIINPSFHTNIYAERQETSKFILPAMDFASKYDEQATERILDVLNKTSVEESARYSISKSRMQKIEKYRKTSGPFRTIEQVLEVEDFGAKILEKFVTSIVESSVKETAGPNFEPPRKLPNNITVPVLQNTKRKTIDTVTSIYMGPKYISWAKIQTSGHLLSWDVHEFEWPKKDNPMLLHDLAVKIRSKLPTSDVYITESAPSYQNSAFVQQAPSFTNLQSLQLTGMLVALLATKFNHWSEGDATPWTADDNVFFLRRQITGQLFNLIVGNETVSARKVICQILDKKMSKSLEHIPPITIDDLETEIYNGRNLVQQEALSKALLMSVAFMELVIKHNPLSIKVATKRRQER